jgi:hypothetical protein
MLRARLTRDAIYVGRKNAQTVFVGNPKENLPLLRRGCRQEDIIKTDSCTKN